MGWSSLQQPQCQAVPTADARRLSKEIWGLGAGRTHRTPDTPRAVRRVIRSCVATPAVKNLHAASRIGIPSAEVAVPTTRPQASRDARERTAASGQRLIECVRSALGRRLAQPRFAFALVLLLTLALSFSARRARRYFLICALGRSLWSAHTIPKTGAARFLQPGTGQY